MKRSALATVGALALAAGFVGGFAIGYGHIVIHTQVITRTLPAPTVTYTRIVYRTGHHKKPVSSPGPVAPVSASFSCRILQTGSSQEEFSVTTTDGATYSGTVTVRFFDNAGSDDTFPLATVQGATSVEVWHPVPVGEVGASADPSGCIAGTG